MAITREVVDWCDEFDRAQALTTTPGMNGWTVKDTSSSGTPTYLCASADGGALVLTLVNTNEAEYVTVYHNDVLNFRLDKLHRVEIIAKVASVDAVTTLVMGLASAARGTHNQAPDAETYNAWFRMEGSVSTSNIVVETDDTVRDNDDVATGTTLSSTYKRFEISFEYGLTDVRFFVDGARVASSTTFNMSNSGSQRMQPYIDIQKASGTGTPAVTIDRFAIVYNIAN